MSKGRVVWVRKGFIEEHCATMWDADPAKDGMYIGSVSRSDLEELLKMPLPNGKSVKVRINIEDVG